MKIGIYVGSFNPVHMGHTNIINYLFNNKYLDKIFIIPTRGYWDKINLIDLKHRINMLKYMENEFVCIDDTNNNLDYTYQVLNEYSKLYRKEDIYLIIGADNIMRFNEWKNIDEILSYNIIVLNRNDIDIMYYIDIYGFDINKFVVISDYPYIDISSSEIRNSIEDNINYLDNRVYQYIKDNKLFRKV